MARTEKVSARGSALSLILDLRCANCGARTASTLFWRCGKCGYPSRHRIQGR